MCEESASHILVLLGGNVGLVRLPPACLSKSPATIHSLIQPGSPSRLRKKDQRSGGAMVRKVTVT